MTDTVEFIGLSKGFGGITALDGITLRAGRGITGLLGPNGAGKSTLLRIAATVLAPDAGTVRLRGLDPAAADDRVSIRRRLGYMPQEPGFYRSFTVFEFLDYLGILKVIADREERHREVRRVLEATDLTGVGEKRVKTLSGGMRRRLALAQALLGRPEVLLLDEPTAGLDPQQRLRFREVVSQLPTRPVILLSTHQTEDVVALCDRVIVIAAGRVRFDGSPADLTTSAAGRVWVADHQDQGAQLSWRMGDGRFRHIGTPPPGAIPADPTIDDAYLLMVGDGSTAPEGTA